MKELLTFMGEIEGFKSYFIADLMSRGKVTLQKAAENEYEHIDQFKLKRLRKAMESKPMLDPFNLVYLGNSIIELGYVSESDMPVFCATIKSLFDLYLGFILLFTQSSVEYWVNLELLKLMKKQLGLVDKHLGAFEDKENILKDIFSSKLLQPLTINMNIDGEKLNDRQKLVLEAIVRIVKL